MKYQEFTLKAVLKRGLWAAWGQLCGPALVVLCNMAALLVEDLKALLPL